MKRFVLTVTSGNELEEVIEGIHNIYSYLTGVVENPPEEEPTMSEQEMSEAYLLGTEEEDDEGFEY